MSDKSKVLNIALSGLLIVFYFSVFEKALPKIEKILILGNGNGIIILQVAFMKLIERKKYIQS